MNEEGAVVQSFRWMWHGLDTQSKELAVKTTLNQTLFKFEHFGL
ncbi:hypothetical protein BVRB_9g209850 [Beta vulgaris subsp. vulgaris]|nr:hypothetical protein BVRB_9g209850 [Beta vulgaris subsp. vulgaris]